MAMFFIRVELHRATEQNYTILHAAMVRAGFLRQVTSDQGKTYHLPTAEYVIVGNYNANQVLTSAKSAAASTGLSYEVLVVQATGWLSENLTPVAQYSRY